MTSLRALSCAVGFLLGSLLLVSGCAVFEPVGNAISRGYENTIAYFNSYYNAKRMFREAEDEILTAQRDGRGRGVAPEDVPVSQGAHQKFNIVIDKCSNVLSFYPSSSLVDDALFLIGKSYYYQADYLKAERKFAEMLSQYPNSSLALEARLWYLRTLNRLKKDSEAELVAATLLETAEKEGEDEILAEGYSNLGLIYSRRQQPDKAVEAYRHAIQLSSNDELKAEIQSRIGAEFSHQGRFEDASAEFAKVTEYTNERSLVYTSRLDEIRNLRRAGKLTVALQRCDEMLDDYRFVANVNNIRFERGQTLVAANNLDEGMADLMRVDTTAARTELGCRASYELGTIYETRLGNYRAAREEYGRALTFPVPDIAPEARKRQTALTRYLSLAGEWAKVDSLLGAVDLARRASAADSSTLVLLSLNPDSLRSVLASHAYGIGEVYYADLEIPDSAVVWYHRAVGVADSVRTPRIMYILAELSAAHPDKHFEDADSLFHQITEQYPRSVYAMRAKVRLGIAVETSQTDPGEALYQSAEASLDSGNTRAAMRGLRIITQEYPLSPYAPKSVYTIGWLYEHVLQQPDSALAEYKTLLQTYAGSSYAVAVKRRMPAPEGSVPDSTGRVPEGKRDGKVIDDEIKKPTQGKKQTDEKEGAKAKGVVKE